MPVEILSSSGHLEQPEGDGARDRATVADSGLSPDWRSDATGIPDGDEQVAAQEGQPSVESTSARELPETAPVGRPGRLTGVDGDPSLTSGTAGPGVLRAVCSWCALVIRDGAEPTTHGICPPCADRMTAEVLAMVRVYPPLHVIPAEDRIGGYVIRDDRDRLIVDRLDGLNKAAAFAHILNNAVHGYGLCVVHLNARRQDGTCFGCTLGAPRHPFAAVGR